MEKLQLFDLNSDSRTDVINWDGQKNILGGGQFDDGKLNQKELTFIDIVVRAVRDKPDVFEANFKDPELDKEIEQKYPDIYKQFAE